MATVYQFVMQGNHYLDDVDADALEEIGNILLKNICPPPQSNELR